MQNKILYLHDIYLHYIFVLFICLSLIPGSVRAERDPAHAPSDRDSPPSALSAHGPSKTESPHTAQSTIEELLRLESRAALELARKKVFGHGSQEGTSDVTESPVLIAIYGTQRRLSAEMRISRRTVIYHIGSKHAVSGDAQGYTLDRIAAPCVYLKKDLAQEVICLEVASQ